MSLPLEATKSLECLNPNLIKTGFSAVGAAVSTAIAKSIQVYRSQSQEKVVKMVNDLKIRASEAEKNFIGTCTSPPYNSVQNYDEKMLISFLICKIIFNKKSLGKTLSNETLLDLCSIINTYSDEKYIAMAKSDYEMEKQAAADAIIQAVSGTTLSNIAVNAGFDALKATGDGASKAVKGFKDVMNPQQVNLSPTDAATKSVVMGSISGVATLGITLSGMNYYTLIKQKIDKAYLPDLNILLTTLTEKGKQIEEANTVFNNCYNIKMKALYKTVKKEWDSRPDKNQNYITHIFKDGERCYIYGKDFDNEKKLIKSNSVCYNTIDNKINMACDAKLRDATLKRLRAERDEIRNIIKEFSPIFNLTEQETIDLMNMNKEITPLLSNINLNSATQQEIQAIIEKLKGVISKNIKQEPQSNKSSFLSRIGFGGKKSKKLRKRERQQKIKRTKTRKHN
jgi:hypothetical protein